MKAVWELTRMFLTDYGINTKKLPETKCELMICGTLLMISAYPICRRIARKTGAELTPEILRLSEEILKS